jgi:glutathione peroxidase
MKWFILLCIGLGCVSTVTSVKGGGVMATNIYDIAVKDIDGRDTTLAAYRGKVMLIVNVASRCGFTGQYDGLQKLYDQHKDSGFVILGFPANNFLGQEPGTDPEIKTFCTLTYGVTFPMFAKISVKGDDKHPLYKFLTEKATNPGFDGEISWNFNKFLISKNGTVLARFGSRTKPESPEITEAIQKAIKE